jgi:pyruvyltransferase
MSKKINAYWYKIKEGHGNFGDELNHYIISRLSGHSVNQVIIPSTGFDYIYKSLSFIFYRVVSLRDYPKLLIQFFLTDFIVGIGSVIAVPNSSKAKIWGSGIIKKDDKINPASFLAVRGKYTQKRLKELNFTVPETIGDPALLLPLIYYPNKTKKYQLGIIPHHIHYKNIKERICDTKIKIINLTDPIEKVIEEINSCHYTISTSLHGIIVSQAYGIPSLWYTYKEKSLFGDNIKFYDYFSSVGIEEYIPFILDSEKLVIDDVITLFQKTAKYSVINYPLEKIQKKLLESAPFHIIKKYKTCL